MQNNKIRVGKFHYFSKHPTRNLIGLYWSVGLMGLGMAMVAVFEPIFLFTQGYTLIDIVFFYLIIYLTYILVLPLFGKLIGKLGFEHSIFYSQFFLIAFYIALFAITKYPVFFFIAPFLLVIQKGLYWPSYHADFVLFSSSKQSGREVGGLETLSLMVYIIGPLIGGLVIWLSNFSTLFILVSALFLLSAIPLLKIKEIHSRIDFKYAEVFKRIFDKTHRRNFFAYLGFGEELIVLIIWPIFIYTVISNYASIGGIVAGATLITGLMVLYISRLIDKFSKQKFLNWGSTLYFFSWIFRILANGVWSVLSMDTFSRFSKAMVYIPLGSMTYESAKKLGPLPHVIYFEQSLAIAKALAAFLLIIIIHYFTDPWLPIFILAAIFSLFYMFYKKYINHGIN